MTQLTEAEERYEIDSNQKRMIMALGRLQEAKELIDEAELHNTLDELLGTLPVMSGKVGEQVYELKKVLGIEPNSFEKDVYEHKQAVATDKDLALDTKPAAITANDDLGLYDAVSSLYKAIEAKNLSKAVNFAQFIQEMAIDYADPNSDANQPQDQD